jgi:hypothetical protein
VSGEKFTMRYYDLSKNWRKVRPHLDNPRVVDTLVRDFNKFTYGRWRQRFTAGRYPREFESWTSTIDRLGILKAKIAELAIEEKELRAVLVECGPGSYEGELFRVTVAKSERKTLDMEAVRKKLTPQFIKDNSVTTQVTTVRIGSRNALAA